jgi:serine/threonine-protein kinase
MDVVAVVSVQTESRSIKPMRLTLTVTEGPRVGQSFTFEEHSTFLVGRSPQAHFRMPEDDRYFSRIHFLIEINPPLCRLIDMKSHNGTYVNGQRVPQADVHNGDLIQAGHTALRVSLAETAPPTAASDEEPMPTLSGAPPGATVPSAGESEAALPPLASPAAGTVVSTPFALSGTSQASAEIRLSNPVPQSPSVLPTIPGYDILRELGRGGMGVVYEARSQADGARAAVKTILPAVKPSAVMLGRFLREARILRELDHPHIVRFRDCDQAGTQIFFAMDFVEGTDAEKLLRSQGPLPVPLAVQLTCQLLDALAYAHVRGFVHRDIKPGNLLVTQEDGRPVAKLADFGLARTYEASQLSGLTMTGSRGGTAAFMPPEQVLDFRTVKPAADQYSSAAALYHLLTGRSLYDKADTTVDLMMKILQSDPVPLRTRRPDLPEALTAAVDRGLSRNAADRFPDVTELRKALAPFAR